MIGQKVLHTVQASHEVNVWNESDVESDLCAFAVHRSCYQSEGLLRMQSSKWGWKGCLL